MTAGGVSAPSFADLLQSAVTEPGILSDAYRQFHNYSIGNQLLAWSQCLERGMQLGPMATFPKWKELGRYVRKGEKAITLCQPVTVKRPADPADDETTESGVFTRFVYRPHWFVLAQTDGAEIPAAPIPAWDAERALTVLAVTEVPFDATNGNVLGFAVGRSIAINPVNPLPHKTRFHELAHVLLGHTAEGVQADGEITPRNLRECEAEAVALLCCAALDLPGVDHCRGYIQSWWGSGNPIPERSAQRVLKVGRPDPESWNRAGAVMTSTVHRVRELVVSYKPITVSLPVGGTGRLSTPRDVAVLASALLAGSPVEKVIALHLNVKHALIGVHVVSIGALDVSIVHPREVFKAACLSNAAGLVLVHNHPSGDPTPSPDDHAIVARLRDVGVLLGIELLDALIVTDPVDGLRYYSFREAGVLR